MRLLGGVGVVLIKSIPTSQAIFHLTSLNFSPCCFTFMNKIERAFLWAGTRTRRLWWPWFEWPDPTKLSVGTDTPHNDVDMDLFYAVTTITIGNGKISDFWGSP
jgi:hypothetical protein